ncbi:MAG: hypothetical protein ACT4N2_10570 [Hyphomicrobium sp.]
MLATAIESLDVSDWIALASAVIAVISGLVAFAYGHAARLSERRLRLVENQISKIDRELVVWGSHCIDAMATAHTLAATLGSGRTPNEMRILRDEVQAKLSALVDAGRLYFINRNPDLVGTDRNYANRGYRPAILDALMIAHEELRLGDIANADDLRSAAQNIFGARRVFISELREEIDLLRDQKALAKMRTQDDDWTEIAKLVDQFEARRGPGTFWRDRPRPRAQILVDIKLGKAQSAT